MDQGGSDQVGTYTGPSAFNESPYSPTGAFVRPNRSPLPSQKAGLTLTGADEEAKFAGLTEAFQKQDTSRHGRLLKQIRDKFTTMSKKLKEQNHVEETSVYTFLGVEVNKICAVLFLI